MQILFRVPDVPFYQHHVVPDLRAGKNVLISAHGNSMRPFRRYFEKLTKAQMMKLENPWDDYFEYRIKV